MEPWRACKGHGSVHDCATRATHAGRPATLSTAWSAGQAVVFQLNLRRTGVKSQDGDSAAPPASRTLAAWPASLALRVLLASLATRKTVS